MRKAFFLLAFLFVAFPQKIFASNFSTDYNVSYRVLDNAKTHVTFNVTLTNSTEQYYASSYQIRVGFDDIQNVVASDSGGPIIPKVSGANKGKEIDIDFNKKVTGLGNKLTFNLSFDTNEVATAIGKVWEINIPGLSNQSEFETFNVTVQYPSFLGRPVSIKPDNSHIINRFSGNKLVFTKSDLGVSGISIAFGEYQIYSFNLTYHLNNQNLFPTSTEIALPPNTNYQEVEIETINPRPQNVRQDKDGNWLAKYNLLPSQSLNIVAEGKARVFLSPKAEKLSEDDLKPYLREEKYWDVNNPEIKKLASELKTPDKIYQYIVDNLTYDFSRVTNQKSREGALGVLKNPDSAVCLEFTDLFVALSRAAGIPAREVDGFANTKNTKERPLSLVKDVLHAWPEYYDRQKQMWIMVDPTWGNTTNGIDYFNTLDFDHFAFVVKGYNSDYPIPAGGYKSIKDLSTKDVNVNLSKDFSENYSFAVYPKFPNEIFPGLPIEGTIKIANTGSVESLDNILKINTDFLKLNKKEILVPRIPPFGNIEIPVSFEKTSLLTNRKDTITISFAKNKYINHIRVSPFVSKWGIIGGGILIVIFIILSVFAARSGRLPISWGKQ